MLTFLNLGFIGKLFKNDHLLFSLKEFILLFYKAKPVDMLLADFIRVIDEKKKIEVFF